MACRQENLKFQKFQIQWNNITLETLFFLHMCDPMLIKSNKLNPENLNFKE